jgi:electron transfer flavoprotein alpha subunit
MAKILVVAESSGNVLKSASLSAITMARQAAAILGASFDILVLGGPGSASAASQLVGYGAGRILLTEDATLSPYIAECYMDTVVAAAADYTLVVATASDYGTDLLPRVAGKLDAAYAGDCVGLFADNGELAFKRSMYAGNVYGLVRLATSQQIVTARQCEFEAAMLAGGNSPILPFQHPASSRAASQIECVSQSVVATDCPQLSEAHVIVSGGRALKRKFIDVLEPLAKVLGAVVGATRAACDAGYAPSDIQVGQTGKSVAPKLYIAVGISGAIQHIAGMKGSKVIVAINKDPDAPIFRLADYGLVANMFEAVPELVRCLGARR